MTYKLTPEQARAEWVKALKSGEYQQAKEALRIGDAFCCLGVACDLFAKIEQDGEWDEIGASMGPPEFAFILDWGTAETALPAPVRNWLGVAGEDGDLIMALAGGHNLAQANDNGASFAAIADAIEAGHLKLAGAP